jgi:hypothetical protein
MQKVLLGGVLLCAALASQLLFAGTLAKDGKTSYVIVAANDAAEPEKTAAKELQSYLKKATDAEFSIADPAGAPADSPKIWIGPSEPVRRLLPEVAWDKLASDAIVIQTVGNDLVLAGGRPRGTLYAVTTFLEDAVGVRWWSSSEEFVPKRPTLEIGSLNVHHQTPFRYRDVYYRDVIWSHGLFASRLRLNGSSTNVPPSHGGNYNILGFCHTFEQLLPPGAYFEKHPEWYSLIKGKRTAERAQLCLTNEEMRKELTRVALEWIRKNPKAGIISVSQNDCSGACECDKCKALKEQEGSESGPLLHFVNAVAADIAKEYPDFLIHTLAYTYTEQPPRHVRPAPNVLVQLCSMGCYFDRPLNDDANQRFRDNLKQWSEIGSNLFIWDYCTNFTDYVVPFTNLQVLAPNVRLFANSHVVGIFEQGDSGSLCGDFVRLRAWLLAHWLWDPSRDEAKLAREFLQGYYGAAAPSLSAYLDLTRKAMLDSGFHLGSYNREYGLLSLQQMNECTRLFDDAERAVAGDPVLSARVRRERLPLDHLWLLRYAWLKREANTTGTPFLGPADPVAACEQFIAAAREANGGPAQYSEGGSPENYEASLRKQVQAAANSGSAAAAPAECAGLKPDQWIDFQEDQISLLSGDVKVFDDPVASNGKAVSIPGNIIDWFTRVAITGDVARAFPKAKFYISARCDAISKNADDHILSIGLYDESAQKNIFVRTVPYRQFKEGAYQSIDLGTYAIKGNAYLWIVASGNAEKLQSVNIDRVFLIREE